MEIKRRGIISFLIALLALSMIALPVLAVYSAKIQVTETSNTSYTELPIIADMDIDYMVNNGYITATGLDTRVQSGGADLPHLLADDRLLFSDGISANSTSNYQFTTGSTALADMPVIVGYDGYVTIPDDAVLEIVNNFTIEFDGYVDTSAGANKNLVIKTDAFRTYVSNTDNITSVMEGVETLRPTGAGDLTQLTASAGANWDCVEETPTDEDATYVVQLAQQVAYQYDLYDLANSSVGAGTINSVTIYNRVRGTADNQEFFRTYLKTGGVAYQGTQTEVPVGYDDYLTVYANNPGGGAWTWVQVDALQAGIGMVNPSSAPRYVRCTQVWVEVDWTGLEVTALGVASGEHKVRTTYDGVNMKIYIDDIEEDSVAWTASAPDNANDWVIMQNNCLPYIDFYKHTVSGTLIAHYQPVTIISGTTLPDLEGVAQDGTITWGANPAGLTVTTGGFVSESQPTPMITGGDEATPDIAPTITQPSNYLTGKDMSTNPLYPLIKPLADLTGFNESWIWITFATIIVLIGMITALGALKSQLFGGIAGFALIALFYQMGVYPFWVLIVYSMIAVGIVLFERVTTY